ncbi:MAG: hypothetical protein C0505_20020, partial [Leptothrix sp. (in: Bacteria)]|nr:hypothetical protein [Leptothrix sp. (in: b-proteobacteria)]
MATGYVSALNEADTRVALAALMDVYNRNQVLGNALLTRLPAIGSTITQFRQFIENDPKLLKISDGVGAATKAMDTAALLNRLGSDTTFLGKAWQGLSDQTLRTNRGTNEVQILDAMMRDPSAANTLLDRLVTGGEGKPVVVLGTTGRGWSVWQEVPIVGLDKAGNFYMVRRDGTGFRRAEGQTEWIPIQSTNPGSTGFDRGIKFVPGSGWRFA